MICPREGEYSKPCELIDGVWIYRHPLPIEGNSVLGYFAEYACALFWELAYSMKLALRRRFDIIHACNPPDLIWVIGLIHKILFGTRFVYDHHDLCPELYAAKGSVSSFVRRILMWLERRSFRLGDAVISTNESYKEIACARGGKRKSEVFVVRSGPDLTRLKPVEPKPALKNGGRYLVGYVGVIGAQEGIDHLLRAAEHVIHQRGREDVRFVIVGGGPELPRLRGLCARMGLDGFVQYTGRIPDEQLLAYLSTADVCVNPDPCCDLNNLSTMNKIMEYMAVGKPIVQYDLKEGRFSAQEASLYARPNDPIDFGDRIIELLDDPSRRARMGEFGRKRVADKLAWHHQVPALLEAYESVDR